MNQKIPTISLIIPAFNEEKYIGACLAHAVRSRSPFLEIIVVDNASTDRTREIATSVLGVRVVTEERKGPMFARARGVQESKGDLVAFIDADTLMPEKWGDYALQKFTHDTKLVCLSGPYRYYDISSFQKVLVWIYWRILAFPVYLVSHSVAVFGNVVIRRDTLLQMGGIDTSIAFFGDDTNLARRAHQFGKMRFDLGFIMHTSGRRLIGQGLWRSAFLYAINAAAELIFHRPITKRYSDIR
ncbi:MAG: hypothetical protein A2664_02855 [Candidatus Taylorbacteria bacterium RIFCSPHIGHO2_01_FULL_46_22b]|uniref:Glycosyltransferase 2-like domain-containing protein n=1 Tax=Candidatus Taylorbacteria bacterium RIFCSPHIGHO2_01_FULL_46_22b TaxID=1802301 RepID=A0A1G2M425_9BACT|nr:MAG: hypothetical protein A2664_02855 [Candidatus Taylorbacteria bacterium RIFCSPHIGHO2_01_FULL_46_22b]